MITYNFKLSNSVNNLNNQSIASVISTPEIITSFDNFKTALSLILSKVELFCNVTWEADGNNLLNGKIYDCLILEVEQSQLEPERFYILEKGQFLNGTWRFLENGFGSNYQRNNTEIDIFYHTNPSILGDDLISISENTENFNLGLSQSGVLQHLRDDIIRTIDTIDNISTSSNTDYSFLNRRAQDVLLLENEPFYSGDLSRVSIFQNILILGRAWIDENNFLNRHTFNQAVNIRMAHPGRLRTSEIGLIF